MVPDGQLQLPFVQTWPPAHATPQAPQFALLALVSTQAPPQLVKLPAPPSAMVVQPALHAPWLQTWPAVHLTPQAPQFAGSSL